MWRVAFDVLVCGVNKKQKYGKNRNISAGGRGGVPSESLAC